MDKIYTPDRLAVQLTELCGIVEPEHVADFAAGTGALLMAGAVRWPNARSYAIDIDADALTSSAQNVSNCTTSLCDFLDSAQRDQSATLISLRRKCDVVLLNPPFSGRGNRLFEVSINGISLSASRALAFVCHALTYLRIGGELIAIIPASCLSSERDAAALATLREVYDVTQVGERLKSAFRGRAVSVVILRVRSEHPSNSTRFQGQSNVSGQRDFSVEVMRGSQPIHRTAHDGAYSVIHTSSLRDGKVVPERLFVTDPTRVVSGPAVLMQRIGRPCVGKIAIKLGAPIVLSDCVIALRTSPAGREVELANILRSEWQSISGAFGGSCAPYLTIRALRSELSRLGISSVVLKDMRVPACSASVTSFEHGGDAANNSIDRVPNDEVRDWAKSRVA